MTIIDDPAPPTRHDLRMLGMLAKQPGWFERLPDDLRRGIVAKLVRAASDSTKTRELVSIARALTAMERNDIARASLMRGVAVEDDDEETQAVSTASIPDARPPEAQTKPIGGARTGADARRRREDSSSRNEGPNVPRRPRRKG